MKFKWITTLEKNYAVVLNITSAGTRETIFINGKSVVDENASSMFHTYNFNIENVDCKLRIFGLNNLVPLFVRLYVNNKVIKRYKKMDSIPSDINPAWLDINPDKLFETTPAWYWLFVIMNAAPEFWVESGKVFQAFPAFLATIMIIHIARSNPKKYTIKKRLSFFVGMTIVNLALTLFLHSF
jgi:hypothetical protein